MGRRIDIERETRQGSPLLLLPRSLPERAEDGEKWVVHHDGGDCEEEVPEKVFPTEDGPDLHWALYDYVQLTDGIRDGDEFFLDGKRVGRVEMPHFVPDSP